MAIRVMSKKSLKVQSRPYTPPPVRVERLNLTTPKGIPIEHVGALHDPNLVKTLFKNQVGVSGYNDSSFEVLRDWCNENVKEFYVIDHNRNIVMFTTDAEKARCILELQGREIEALF